MDSIVLHLELLWLQVQVRILPLFHQLSNIYYYVVFTCIVVFMKFCSNSHIDYTKVMNIYISALKKKCCSSTICVTMHINLILFWRFHKDLMCTKVRVLENNENVLTVQSTAVTYHVYHLIVDLAHPKFPPRHLLWVLLSFLQRTILLWHLLGLHRWIQTGIRVTLLTRLQ